MIKPWKALVFQILLFICSFVHILHSKWVNSYSKCLKLHRTQISTLPHPTPSPLRSGWSCESCAVTSLTHFHFKNTNYPVVQTLVWSRFLSRVSWMKSWFLLLSGFVHNWEAESYLAPEMPWANVLFEHIWTGLDLLKGWRLKRPSKILYCL